jgi:hypothetical protein
MPRGKGTVYAGSCATCGARVTSKRILKSKKADFKKFTKYCSQCRKRTEIKIKEEKHSS